MKKLLIILLFLTFVLDACIIIKRGGCDGRKENLIKQ